VLPKQSQLPGISVSVAAFEEFDYEMTMQLKYLEVNHRIDSPGILARYNAFVAEERGQLRRHQVKKIESSFPLPVE
jgi:hypothetical protein